MAEANGIDASVLLAALRSADRTAPTESECEPVRLAMTSGEHRAALELSASLLRSRRATPQLITAFCVGLFRCVGPASLSPLLGALREMVGPSWERVACTSSREKQCEAALNAALRDIATFWQFSAAQPSLPIDWAPFDRSSAVSTLADIATFRAAFGSRWEHPRFSAQLSVIEALLRAVRITRTPAPTPRTTAAHDEPAGRAVEVEPAGRAVEVEPAGRAVAVEPAGRAVAVEPAGRAVAVEAEPAVAEHAGQPSFALPSDEPQPTERVAASTQRDEIVLPVTAALRELLEKLDAFDALIERGEALRAAIIADDVQSVIDRFDPRRFFPALFAEHVARRVEHRAALAEARQLGADERDELELLYRVDLRAFVGR